MMNNTTGLQLWTVKQPLAQDFEGTLSAVASMGYRTVEVAGYDIATRTFHNRHPKVLKEKITHAGMELIGVHAVFDFESTTKVLEDAAAAGMQYIIYAYLTDEQKQSIDSYKKVAEAFNKVGTLAQQYGIRFGYHNHAFELKPIDGQLPYDVLLQYTNAETVIFEMDLGWVIHAGYHPVDFFNKYPQRFPLWHVRDLDAAGQSVAIGNGTINYAPIFAAQATAGLQHYFVEIGSNEPNAIENSKTSFLYLQAQPFVTDLKAVDGGQ